MAQADENHACILHPASSSILPFFPSFLPCTVRLLGDDPDTIAQVSTESAVFDSLDEQRFGSPMLQSDDMMGFTRRFIDTQPAQKPQD